MNAQIPPFFCASDSRWYSSVVLPDDSGPNTSTIRPRGMPPTPSAMSSESAPVGIASTRTAASSSPIRMIEPLPNWRSICESAPFRAASRALAAFSCSLSAMDISAPRSLGIDRLRADADGTRPPGKPLSPDESARELHPLERLVPRPARGKMRAIQRHPLRGEGGLRRRQGDRLDPADTAPHPGERDVRPEGPPLGLVVA